MRPAAKRPDDQGRDAPATLRATRRAILRGGLATGLGVIAAADLQAPLVLAAATDPTSSGPAGTPPSEETPVAVFPFPGSQTASPGTEISFRGASPDRLGQVTVVGTQSGAHSGTIVPHADGQGASYVPDAPFQPGESITAQAGLRLGAEAEESVTFTVARPAPPATIPPTREADAPEIESQAFRSRQDLTPPVVAVTTPGADTAEGMILLGPRSSRASGQLGAMILDGDGELVWFAPVAGEVEEVFDVRVQEYQGQPVLTRWVGVKDVGYGLGHFLLCDGSYQEIATIRVGNGYGGADFHEFLLTAQGTALIIVYNPVYWDLSSIGGAQDGAVVDGIIQELEVGTGRVLFEWHSLDHIGVDESVEAPNEEDGESFDYVHLNSVEVDRDGHLIVSARNTSAVYKIDRQTGEVLWRLGGTQSDFTMGEGAAVAFQHDARVHPSGELTIFDNAARDDDADVVSRGVVLSLDPNAMTATLMREYVHPDEFLATTQGNLQTLPNGNAFVGWGNVPAFSEFGPDGALLFDARFPEHVECYRSYRFPWVGRPADAPAIAVEAESEDEGAVTVYASWNGATEVAEWQVLAGPEPDRLEPASAAARTGFETALTVESSGPYFAVRALDNARQVLGVSEARQLGD